VRLALRFHDWPLRAKLVALLLVASLLPQAIAATMDIREAQEHLISWWASSTSSTAVIRPPFENILGCRRWSTSAALNLATRPD
jgi:hypothetical protein